MDIRDWLAIIVIVFIVLILLDGFRRKWIERKNRIVMKLDKNIPPAEDIDEDVEDVLTRSELPSGGARVIPRDDEPSDSDVPVLMESVELDDEEIEDYSEESAEQEVAYHGEDEEGLAATESWEKDEFDSEEMTEDASEDTFNDVDDYPVEPSFEEKSGKSLFVSRQRESEDDRIEPSFGDEELTFSHDEQGELDLEHNELIDHEQDADPDSDEEQEVAEEVIVINVMAKSGMMMEGSKILPVLLRHGMRLGDMSIFHRHADSDGHGPVMFSMANMLKPGTFTMAEMETFQTPGVSFFMQMPNKLGNMQCFEQMLKTAEAVKAELDAELKDENRSIFTRQTIEHSRQRISDFELEMLARK